MERQEFILDLNGGWGRTVRQAEMTKLSQGVLITAGLDPVWLLLGALGQWGLGGSHGRNASRARDLGYFGESLESHPS